MNSAKILKVIKQNRNFIVTTHVNPDIDGLASALVLALYLKSKGKKVRVITAEPLPQMYRFLLKSHLIEELNQESIGYDVMIVVDCGDFERIGKVSHICKKDKILINIDHHITNNYFGTINLVKPKTSSSAEVVFDLLAQAKCRLNKEMAQLLYMGILTDTGSFRYDNTTSHTHRIISTLMKFKFSVHELYKKIYENIPLSDLKILTSIFNSFDISHQGWVVCVSLTNRMLKKFSGSFDLKERIFSFLRSIKGVEAIIIFSESHPHLTRINFRSQGQVDVAQLASYFGGGGHQKASGCQISANIKNAKKKVFLQLNKIL